MAAKLKYFCQMCNKQCRDKNGFKCHTESESHRQQMLLFLSDPEKYISQFSIEFEADFLARLSLDWILPSEVYNALIRDPEHTHLNATRWTSLALFLDEMATSKKIERKNDAQGRELVRSVKEEKVQTIVRHRKEVSPPPVNVIDNVAAPTQRSAATKIEFGLKISAQKRVYNAAFENDLDSSDG